MTRAFHRTTHLLSALALASSSMPGGAFSFLLPGAGKPAVTAATGQQRTLLCACVVLVGLVCLCWSVGRAAADV